MEGESKRTFKGEEERMILMYTLVEIMIGSVWIGGGGVDTKQR